MATLSLFRHAKSAWGNPTAGDFDRPLAPRGTRTAPLMGRFMAEQGLEPDIVLCSTATRARQTLDLALPEFNTEPEVRYTDDLYGAGPADMVKLLRALEETCSHAMLVGHNPGMQALALDLVGSGDDANIRSLAQKFPTAALAVIDFDDRWPDLAPGKGFLRIFMVPKALPKT